MNKEEAVNKGANLSGLLSLLKPSATLEITSKAKSMAASGEDVVILAAGEPDFDTPQSVKQAAVDAINRGETKYTPAVGTLSLRKAISEKLKKDNGVEYSPGEIIVSNGAKHSIYNALQALCNPGDEVVIIHPYWLSYPEMVTLAGATPVVVKTSASSGFKASAEDIKNAITGKTKALILNSPSNPSGAVYEKQDLKAISDICLDNGVYVISDEIYEKIMFDGIEHFSIASLSPEARDMTVLVNGVSKSYSMTGWRIGYLAADTRITSLISGFQSQTTSNPCSISQAAAEFALTSPELEAELEKNRAEYKKRRDEMMNLLAGNEKIQPFKPLGAFYLFCDISATGMSSVEFAGKLLRDEKVAVIPGGPFGEDSFVRMSFATSLEKINEGVDRISRWLEKV